MFFLGFSYRASSMLYNKLPTDATFVILLYLLLLYQAAEQTHADKQQSTT